MNANTTQERQLKREIRWAKEALAIAENCETNDSIREAYKQQIPIEYRHLADLMGPDEIKELESHIERRKTDLENLKNGEWE